ncbi:MAG: hypothetical protein RLZZ627_1864 [Pseudomonadota bacterium]|jgi:hypothetical protein
MPSVFPLLLYLSAWISTEGLKGFLQLFPGFLLRDRFVFSLMNVNLQSCSPALAELTAFFEAMTWPATDYDRRTFEALLRCVAPSLSAPEKGEAERLARHLFTDIESLAGARDSSR